MDFDETWKGWSAHIPLQVLLFFGQIRPGADPGRGQNRSSGVPFFKKRLLQTGRLQRQIEWIAMIYKHVGNSVVIFGSIPKSNFWRVFDAFLDSVIFAYFNAIFIDFYAVKSFICIYFVQFPCFHEEECLYERFECLKNFNDFFCIFLGEGRGCTYACICMGTHSQPFLQKRLMDVYKT